MPRRKTPLVTGQTYHVFNRGSNKQPIFFTVRDYERAIATVNYYLAHKPHLAYSQFNKLTNDVRKQVSLRNNKLDRGVSILCYTLMPNHYHILLKQLVDTGITSFVTNFQISLTKYVNTKRKRTGPLLQGQFKAVRIEDDKQLSHVNRYIHLNPLTSFVVKNLEELKNYKWSSLPEYLGLTKENVCNKDLITKIFNNKTDRYWQFLVNQVDYQRSLEAINHLTLE